MPHGSSSPYPTPQRLFAARLAVPTVLVLAGPLAGLAADSTPEELQVVEVIGIGEARQVQRLGAAQFESLPGGFTALKALERLPGVNFQSADPFGANEWSTRLTVRGFTQNQLGFTLDGVPLGDMSYANHNGLHASRAIASEDLREVRLSQGAGALGTASTSNLGGTVEFFSSAPDLQAGVRVGLAGGSDGAQRLQGRIDSGLLDTGTSLFISGVDQRSSKWRGTGDQNQRNLTFKMQQDLGAARLVLFANHSDRVDIDYQDLSLDLIARRGYFWDNWTPDWNSAVQAAGQCAASGFSNPAVCDEAYWDSSTLRRDLLTYAGVEAPIGERLKLDAKVYLHDNDGQGLWATPYTPTPGGAPFSIRVTDFDMDRRGVLTRATWQWGNHNLQTGLWHELNRFSQTRMFIGEPSLAGPTRSFYRYQDDPFSTQWQYAFETRTWHVHLQDEWQVAPALKLTYGAKSVDVKNQVATVTGPVRQGRIRARDRFLPQAGAVWKLSSNQELFGSLTQNLRAHVSAAFAGPFGTSSAGFEAIRDTLQPERSTTVEAGWRYATRRLHGAVAVYHVDYRDRLLGIQQGPIILGNPTVLANVGSVRTRGAELAFGWKPTRWLDWFSAVTLNDSRFEDDYVTNGRTVAVDGLRLPDAPRTVLRSELTFDTGRVWARFIASHVGRRYYTYLNDGAAPAYTLFNLGLGVRLERLALLLDVRNLADKRYIATVGSADFAESDPAGTRQTLLTGAPRQYFVTLRSRF